MSILALILILAGTALGAYIQMNYRSSADDKRDEIERISKVNKRLNDSIETISKRNEELNKTINSTTALNQNLINENIELANKNQELAQANLELSKITATFSKEISRQNTEGDSYPDFQILNLMHEGKPIFFMTILNSGTNPLFDVDIHYFSQDELSKKFEGFEDGNYPVTTTDLEPLHHEHVAEIKPKGAYRLNRIFYRNYFESENLKTFKFEISTRTKAFRAILQLRYVNGKFEVAKEVKQVEREWVNGSEKITILKVPVRKIDPNLIEISEIKKE